MNDCVSKSEKDAGVERSSPHNTTYLGGKIIMLTQSQPRTAVDRCAFESTITGRYARHLLGGVFVIFEVHSPLIQQAMLSFITIIHLTGTTAHSLTVVNSNTGRFRITERHQRKKFIRICEVMLY